MTTLAFLPNLGPWEWLIIGLFLLLIFGRRLPEVGRSLGKGLVEFKKGIRDIQDDVTSEATKSEPAPKQYESVRPPLTPGGEDVRVSRDDDPVEQERTPDHAG